MNKFYITILAIGLSLGLNAQTVTTKGAVISAGNQYGTVGNHVYFYYLDTDVMQSEIVDSIQGDFSNHVISDGHYLYAHVGRGGGHPLGGDRIFKYDLTNQDFGPVDSTDAIIGIKTFQISGDRLVITRAFPVTSEFVQILDKNDLSSVLYSDTNIPLSCDGIAFGNNKAYIASSLISDSGVVHVIDLGQTIAYDGAIVLDTVAVGGQEIYFDNNMLYMSHARFNPDYSVGYAGVTAIDLSDSTFVSDTTGFVVGTVYSAASAFDYFDGKILANFGNPVETYDVMTGVKTNLVSTFPSDAKKDPNSAKLLVQTTDYFSIGEVTVYDGTGTSIFNMQTKVSGAAMGMATNYYPTAVNDSINGGSPMGSQPHYFDVMDNDYDRDGQQITLDTLLNQPNVGFAEIVGDSIKISNIGNFDTIYYVISDPWGDTDTAFLRYSLIGSVQDLEVKTTSVYPNPVNDILNIRTENEAIEAIQILDLTGRVVKASIPVSNQATIDVSDFNTGIYLIQITVNGKVETHRLIVQ